MTRRLQVAAIAAGTIAGAAVALAIAIIFDREA